VNSGRATKKGSIEETALETNLEAAEEIARQLRLRDLAGLIVIDFIDMEERKNNASVEKRFKDKLKTDRARIQVGRISGFGLLEMSRQRLRPGMLEATTQPCPHCHGTGLVRSDDSLGLTILRQIEEEGVRKRSREVLVKAPVSIVNFLMNHKREHIAQIEARYGMAVRVEADPFLISPDFSMEKFKTATRVVEALPVISANASLMADIDEAEDEEDIVDEAAEEAGEDEEAPSTQETGGGAAAANGDGAGRKRRRRRRRRRGGNGTGEGMREERQQDASDASDDDAEGVEAGDTAEAAEALAEPAVAEEGGRPKRSRSRSRARGGRDAPAEEAVAEVVTEAAAGEVAEVAVEEAAPAEEPVAEEKPKRKRAPRKKKDEAAGEAVAEPAPEPAAEAVAEPEPLARAAPAPAPEPVAARAPEPVAAVPEDDNKPKKKGWWSLR
jgi:ribonuclease E